MKLVLFCSLIDSFLSVILIHFSLLLLLFILFVLKIILFSSLLFFSHSSVRIFIFLGIGLISLDIFVLSIFDMNFILFFLFIIEDFCSLLSFCDEYFEFFSNFLPDKISLKIFS